MSSNPEGHSMISCSSSDRNFISCGAFKISLDFPKSEKLSVTSEAFSIELFSELKSSEIISGFSTHAEKSKSPNNKNRSALDRLINLWSLVQHSAPKMGLSEKNHFLYQALLIRF